MMEWRLRILLLILLCASSHHVLAQKNKDTSGRYTIVDPIFPVPEFPGGEARLKKFIRSNLRQVSGAKGKKVFISFTVEKDGRLTHFKVERGVSDKANQEAIRVMKSTPKWKPVIYNGHAERSRFTLPVTFTR